MKLMTATQEIIVYFVVPDGATRDEIQRAADDAMRSELRDNPPHYGSWAQEATPGVYEQEWEPDSLVYGTKRGESENTLGEAMMWPRTP